LLFIWVIGKPHLWMEQHTLFWVLDTIDRQEIIQGTTSFRFYCFSETHHLLDGTGDPFRYYRPPLWREQIACLGGAKEQISIFTAMCFDWQLDCYVDINPDWQLSTHIYFFQLIYTAANWNRLSPNYNKDEFEMDIVISFLYYVGNNLTIVVIVYCNIILNKIQNIYW
jgi:hypothetical protein